MFGTIRKHQTWLWAVIVTVTIISFVSFFNPNSRNSGQRSGTANYGAIDGQKISEEEFVNAYNEANLIFFMRHGSFPNADAKRMGYDPDHDTYERLLFLAKLRQHHIQVDDDSVARMANMILANFGRGTPVPLKTFEDRVLAPQHLTADDFQRFIRHDLALQQLFSTLGVAGKLVTPAEAQELYVREQQEMSVNAVFFSASNYLSSVAALPAEAVSLFYTNQMSAYRVPERLQVSYVQFDITNFMADADEQIAKLTNYAGIVDQEYLQRGTNYYKDNITAEEAKTKIRAEMHHELATTAARKKANDFASELYDQQPQRPENLAAFATAKGLTAKISAPFDEANGPDFDGGVNFAKTAFKLTAEDPFAGPLPGGEAIYVIALNKRFPSEIPPLTQIRSRVEADAKYSQAARLARTAGVQFAAALTNGLAQGKTFAGIATDAKVKPAVIPPFSLGTRELPEVESQVTLIQFKQIVFDTPVGKSSGFIPTREGGLVVFVSQRLPLDEAKMRADMPEFLKGVRQARQNEAINFWYRREAEKQPPQVRDILQGRSRQPSLAPGQSRS